MDSLVVNGKKTQHRPVVSTTRRPRNTAARGQCRQWH